MNDYYTLFRNPLVKHRSEEFGGIVKTKEGIYLLDEKAYNIFLNAKGEQSYKEMAIDDDTKEILDKLINLSLLLKIKESDAKCIKKKMMKNI